MDCLLYINHTSIKLRKIAGEKEGEKTITAIASGKLVDGNIGTREGNYPC